MIIVLEIVDCRLYFTAEMRRKNLIVVHCSFTRNDDDHDDDHDDDGGGLMAAPRSSAMTSYFNS